ncbi:MAG: response regulator, partial [Moraxellaceae bacterium]|nr:response regulator [Moraxellaceae bacterium]
MSQPVQDHILVIDDEPVVCESLAVYLSDSGFKVNTASSGDEGLALFRNIQPDLVICDLRMPLVDGLDVLKAINSESPETPVIVVSGQGSMNDVVTALRNGAVDYLFKPLIEMEVLEHSVRRALERGYLLKQNRQIREQLERSLALLKEDQEAGRRVQLRMLPPTPHVFNEDCHFSHRIIPSLYLSGDFVDYFRMGPDRIGFYLADVSGHGASSAFVTVFLK